MTKAVFSAKPTPLGDGERILVVEDNDNVREATESRLKSLGYAVLKARTAIEAIKLLESGKQVVVVFSDIMMPGGMTGYDVAEWVRSKKPGLKLYSRPGITTCHSRRTRQYETSEYLANLHARAARSGSLRGTQHLIFGAY